MRRQLSKYVLWLTFAALAAITPGCFSLGLGTTTYVHEKPETLSRIDSLESRVSNLENRLGAQSPLMLPATPVHVETITPAEILVE